MKGKLLSLNLKNKRTAFASFEGRPHIMDRNTRMCATYVDARMSSVVVYTPQGGLYLVPTGE